MRRALIQSVTAPTSNWPQCLGKQKFKLDLGGSENYERLSKREEIGVLWHARITLFGLEQGTILSFGTTMFHFEYLVTPFLKSLKNVS